MMKIWDVIIVGTGPSGLIAAITAAREGKTVLMIEKNEKIGKKLYATGNGKCNFTNANFDLSFYEGDKELLSSVFGKFSVADTLHFFEEIGIYPKEKNGYYYPNSEQASSVVKALQLELSLCQVEVLLSCHISEISKKNQIFTLFTNKGSFMAQKIIVATGLLASPKLGSDGSFFPIIKELGHHFTPILPSLCGFYATGMKFQDVKGVRHESGLQLYIDNNLMHEEIGELQFNDYGISGIPVFQLATLASRGIHAQKDVMIKLDLLPGVSYSDLLNELERRARRLDILKFRNEFLNGLIPEKLIPIILNHKSVQMNHLKSIVSLLKGYKISLVKYRNFEQAQVCCGGIVTQEINLDTLESKLQKGIFFAGEILDVCGICGGYNLQWAWSSGVVAAKSVINSLNG